MSMHKAPAEITVARALAYGAPVAGSWFFYIPMWSILPGFYAKYGGLTLGAIAMVVFVIRLFDGIVDTTVGYLSDWHRSRGGSRKTWVAVGCLGTVVASSFLLVPPRPATSAYYLTWSMAFFLAFTIAEIPHIAWGSELSMSYRQRTQIFGMRNVMTRIGTIIFYGLPLLSLYPTHEYTPNVMRDATYIGASLTVLGLAWAITWAPEGSSRSFPVTKDNLSLLLKSLVGNGPLVRYFVTFGFLGTAGGMWFGLVYFYLDSYLKMGAAIAPAFLIGSVIGVLSTPLWLGLVARWGKATAWAVSVMLFVLQLAALFFLKPGTSWWVPYVLVAMANLYFCGHDITALALLGDIVDYGKLKFRRDRGATYFALNILIFKFGLGLGGGLALGLASWFGFVPSAAIHSAGSIDGLKLACTVIPACLALVAFALILGSPINRRRHLIIKKRIESQVIRYTA
jgi:glycoside/pentoside/hexuronide:cation symporter, GPH family